MCFILLSKFDFTYLDGTLNVEFTLKESDDQISILLNKMSEF